MPDDQPRKPVELWEQPWFEASAIQSRALSQRYWAGPAGNKYSVHDDVYRFWPEAPDEAQVSQPATRRGRS